MNRNRGPVVLAVVACVVSGSVTWEARTRADAAQRLLAETRRQMATHGRQWAEDERQLIHGWQSDAQYYVTQLGALRDQLSQDCRPRPVPEPPRVTPVFSRW